jgi:hypothetical protein
VEILNWEWSGAGDGECGVGGAGGTAGGAEELDAVGEQSRLALYEGGREYVCPRNEVVCAVLACSGDGGS